jgi:hypothetical protein
MQHGQHRSRSNQSDPNRKPNRLSSRKPNRLSWRTQVGDECAAVAQSHTVSSNVSSVN